jgi:DNA-binding NtrC family response regulator
MKESVLLVDDEEKFAFFAGELLKDEGYEVTTVHTGGGAISTFAEKGFELVLLDLKLPDMDGLEVLRKIREGSDCPVIIVTAFGSIKNAVEAIRAGATDYLVKPFEMEELLLLSKNVLDRFRTRRELRFLKEKDKKQSSYIMGGSEKMKPVHELALKAATSESVSVLIEGESGSGKEWLARFIHQNSNRADGSFVEISCAIPDTLLESELFGYEAGAFTDAKRAKPGLLEIANNGTTLLDEVGDLSANAQAKVLRSLETKTFRRLGGIKDLRTDTRIIAASNKDLRTAVNAGSFRLDLFYRLAVINIKLPPLRERKEDIPVFAQFFVDDFAKTLKKQIWGISARTMEMLLNYSWPGNIRELRNTIERAVILAEGNEVQPRHIFLEPLISQPVERVAFQIPDALPPEGISLPALTAGFERKLIKKSLKLTNGNKVKAAKLLGISRNILAYSLKKYNIAAENSADE